MKYTNSYNPSNAFVARLPAHISGHQQFFNILFETLLLPGYFGFNWDALSDCLRDFHWIEKELIVIVHENLPEISLPELKIYIEILSDSVLDWKLEGEHQLEIFFPESVKEQLVSLLDENE